VIFNFSILSREDALLTIKFSDQKFVSHCNDQFRYQFTK